MKAIGYLVPQAITEPEAFLEFEIPEPVIQEEDLLVQIKAVSINPIDYKVRSSRMAEGNQPVILGWDAAGIVIKKGKHVSGFEMGDEVFYAGELLRPGSNAQLQAVNYKLVGKKPKNIGFSEAAALPLTSLTAYEALFEKLKVPVDTPCNVMIIGGAGGVGSIAIQLLKQLTKAKVYATYGRPESLAWLKSLNVDVCLDRNISLKDHFKNGTLPAIEYVFSTTHSNQYIPELAEIMAPFGQYCLIDRTTPGPDFGIFAQKAISIHWELMFTKSLFKYKMESQGQILNKIASLVEAGKLKSTLNKKMQGLNTANFINAHKVLESAESIGKITIEL